MNNVYVDPSINEVVVSCACGDVLDGYDDDTACPNVVFWSFKGQDVCQGWMRTETKVDRVILTNDTCLDRDEITKIKSWCESRLDMPDGDD